jgi:hypothetical protein
MVHACGQRFVRTADAGESRAMSIGREPRERSVVRPVPIDPTGRAGPTRGEAAGPGWRRTSRGLYVPSSVPGDDTLQRSYEASMLLPEYGGVEGWAALHWAGARYIDGFDSLGLPRPVPLAVMHSDIRGRPGILVSSERLAPRDLTSIDGFRVTTHVRSVGFEMRYAAAPWLAVIVCDMAAYDDLVSIAELSAYVATLNGWTGVPQCRAALALASENSWSPMETFMRLVWVVLCGFPMPLCNQPLFDRDGRHVATPDLVDIEAGVVGEYEGPLHLNGQRRGSDLVREDVYRRLGLEYFAMVRADRSALGATVVPRMVAARNRARFEAESTRAWTVIPPAWWTSTTTVAARRALTQRQRERLLRYRAG